MFAGIGKQMQPSHIRKTGFERISSLCAELDQSIITLQSKVNLGDFLLNDPSNLFVKFGKDTIMVRDFDLEC